MIRAFPVLFILTSSLIFAADPSYVVVVSKQTHADPAWKAAADALVKKHHASLIQYDADVTDCLPALKQAFPKYTCFVATPKEANRDFVAKVHRLTRKLDDDPYTDTLWGILTGYDAANALRIATQSEPLVIHKVASGTEVALDQCEQGVWYCELVQNKMLRKEKGGKPEQLKGPSDTTKALADLLNDYKPDLFLTSGHATERDWQIGFRYKNGSFRCASGQLFGLDTSGQKHPINSPNSKVYLPIGNCLMGHIDGLDAMALAWMNSAGVNQMIGYTVPTWYGYQGWGCLDYFVEQPGRYTFTTAFFANHHALIHRLATYFPDQLPKEPPPGQMPRTRPALTDAAKAANVSPQDAAGLLFDRDVVALYGDPAWSAKMADGDNAFDILLTQKDDLYTLEIKPRKGPASFDPINTNGAQRGRRPFVHFLPHRIAPAQILEGATLNPTITDDFVLIPHPAQCDPTRQYKLVFRAKPLTSEPQKTNP